MQTLRRFFNPDNEHLVINKFDAFQDGVLTVEETAVYQQHLAGCPECQAWVETQVNIGQQLRNEMAPSAVLSPTSITRVHKNISNHMRRAMIMSQMKTVFRATAVLAVLIVGFFFWQFITPDTLEPAISQSEPIAVTRVEQPAEPTVTLPTKLIEYAHVNDTPTTLNIYPPNETGSWPVVIIVPSSISRASLASGQRLTYAPLAEAIAAEGAVVYTIRTIFRSDLPFTNDIKRVTCAIRYARATAADYGGNPERIILVGHGAGGGIGATVALAGDDFGAEGCVVKEGSVAVDGFVAYEGFFDFATVQYSASYLSSFSHSVWRSQAPEEWEAINPYTHIGQNPELPIRLLHGDHIGTNPEDVQMTVSHAFNEALTSAEYDVELVIVPDGHHDSMKASTSDGFAMTVEQVMALADSVSP